MKKTPAEIRELCAALVTAHKTNTTPAETVAALVSQIGQESAVYIIAAMVNAKGEWDGRISSTVRAWASVDGIPTKKQLDGAYIWYCDEIHPTHMDQLARAMMEYQPEGENTESTAAEPEPSAAGLKNPAYALDIATVIIKDRRDRSAWDKGVSAYALELIDSIVEQVEYEKHYPETVAELIDYALNGARDWDQYSWGGRALIYDCDIAERLCCPSELKRVKGGERRPNASEEWLDVQARALKQAYTRIKRAWCEYMEA